MVPRKPVFSVSAAAPSNNLYNVHCTLLITIIYGKSLALLAHGQLGAEIWSSSRQYAINKCLTGRGVYYKYK